MEDFSVWLAGAASEGDHVVLAMDLGSGREFQLLQHLVQVSSAPSCISRACAPKHGHRSIAVVCR